MLFTSLNSIIIMVIKMLQKAHIQKFHTCKKYMPSNRDMNKLKLTIDLCVPIVNYFINNYNIHDVESLKQSISYFIQLVYDDFSESQYIDSSLYELQATKSILKNPALIDKILPNVKDTANNHFLHNANLARSQKLVIINAIDEISKLEAFAEKYDITANTNLSTILVRSDDSEKIRSLLKLCINILKQNNLHDKIVVFLQKQKTNLEDFIKNNQITSLKSLYDFFSSLGFLSRYLDIYNTNSAKFGFADLDYHMSSTDSAIGFNESFSEDFLKTLPLQDLCFLNAFWCNRFAKECSHLSSAFVAINSLDLWQDILDGHTEFSLSENELIAVLQKSNFLTTLIRDTCIMHQNKVVNAELKNKSIKLTEDYADYYHQLHNFINKDYVQFFSNNLIENDFFNDLSFCTPFIDLSMNAYNKKQTTLEPLIKNALDNPVFKNWGIIRNELVNGNYVDSISSNMPMCLLYFDLEGYNMPFCFHISKDSLTDLVRLSNENYLIPEYQGGEDFIVNNEHIPTNIIMPVPKHHKKIIMDNAKLENLNQNLWEHFYFLMNGKFPKHLTENISKKPKQPMLSRMPIIYTNLKTGKRYVRNNNQFIEVNNDEYSR